MIKKQTKKLNKKQPQKKKVIFLDKQNCIYPVVTRGEDTTECFQCCADILPEQEE